LIITGVRGPLAGIDTWLFENVPAAAAFREFYHAAPLVAFPASVLAASAVDGFAAIARRTLTCAVVANTLLLCAYDTTWSLPSFDGVSVAQVAQSFGANDGSGVVSAPLVHPVGPAPHFGIDPSAWSTPDVSAYWVYEPSQPALAVGTALQCGDPALPSILARGNVSYEVMHRGWSSGVANTPSIPVRSVAQCLRQSTRSPASARLVSIPSGDAVAVFTASTNGAWSDGMLPVTPTVDGQCDSRLPAGFEDAVVLADLLALDPSENWVPARPFYRPGCSRGLTER
jgi:hypothetical protein